MTPTRALPRCAQGSRRDSSGTLPRGSNELVDAQLLATAAPRLVVDHRRCALLVVRDPTAPLRLRRIGQMEA
jgi:hypothetical protein